MDAVTVFAAIAAVSAAIILFTSIFSSSRAASTGEQQSLGSVPPDPRAQELGETQGGPDIARMIQLFAIVVLVVAVVALVILLFL